MITDERIDVIAKRLDEFTDISLRAHERHDRETLRLTAYSAGRSGLECERRARNVSSDAM